MWEPSGKRLTMCLCLALVSRVVNGQIESITCLPGELSVLTTVSCNRTANCMPTLADIPGTFQVVYTTSQAGSQFCSISQDITPTFSFRVDTCGGTAMSCVPNPACETRGSSSESR